MRHVQKQGKEICAAHYIRKQELAADILHTFIERVKVGERAAKYSRSASQEIRIYCRGIGLIGLLPENLREENDHKIA